MYVKGLFLSTQLVRAQLCSQEGAGEGGPTAEAQTGKPGSQTCLFDPEC